MRGEGGLRRRGRAEGAGLQVRISGARQAR